MMHEHMKVTKWFFLKEVQCIELLKTISVNVFTENKLEKQDQLI